MTQARHRASYCSSTGDGAILYFLDADGRQHVHLVMAVDMSPGSLAGFCTATQVQPFVIFNGKGWWEEKQTPGVFSKYQT